jgi:hypothetical protein
MPYFSRQKRSSEATSIFTRYINIIKNKEKSQEAAAILILRITRNMARYIGCLEYLYSPLVMGTSRGMAAKVVDAITSSTNPNAKIEILA